ncbi:flagellar hook-associated protein FlgK [Alkalicoccus urumqiensis]|uniref:Flagellar hook-associated protein 1 n=1 Tax=Alkalicoccus urumqiensis TaxID=1548213 RepID=A0A2P6MHA7_ALKUR|nr:flagellar hook-associated protein FlgK [Alkalicoccus urumqiensis]PRO65664.1 flagellar hook-associated protein FlgK [Alkalicoccus urumqiensis]
MLSTFSGLETMRRALSTNQAALKTVGHNISNANTEGYSRQRVNIQQSLAFPQAAFNKPAIPGQMGTGSEAESVQRVREAFLDVQYREENQKNGYWGARVDALTKMEDIMNEPSDDGIAQTMDRFWESLQDLSVNPEDSGARSVVRQRGIALAETIGSSYQSLESIQRDYKSEIGVQENSLNSKLRQLNDLNRQIASVEPHGQLPNDLYDQRDVLVDELSSQMNIKVERIANGGQSKDQADGSYHITAIDDNGKPIKMTDADGNEQDMVLVNGRNLTHNQVKINYASFPDGSPAGEQLQDPVRSISLLSGGEEMEMDFSSFGAGGSLRGIVEAYGYTDADENGEVTDVSSIEGIFPNMLSELDTLVTSFAKEFNAVHQGNWNMMDIKSGEHNGLDFFSTGLAGRFADAADNEAIVGVAKNFDVSQEIKDSLDNIAAASEDDGTAFAGDGSGALALANVKDEELTFAGNTANVQSYYQSVIGEMAVDTNEAGRLEKNTAGLRNAVEERRMSTSSVSLDEEMSMMIQFQHAYNAAARNLTAMDEILDRVINGMGRVGI